MACVKKHIIVANWKMYVEKPDTAKHFASVLRRRMRSFKNADVLVAPPFLLIPTVAAAFKMKGKKNATVRLAAQTVSAKTDGKHTGEISAPMLKNAGVSAVIIGHSERREAGEGEVDIHAQVESANASGLVAILCVGERERDPSGSHFNIIAEQLSSALKNSKMPKFIIAYEPVWAIGKSAEQAMKPAELQETVIFIRKTLADILGRAPALKTPVLYGGSVDATNARELLRDGGASGFLVGRASADIDSFIELLNVCQKP